MSMGGEDRTESDEKSSHDRFVNERKLIDNFAPLMFSASVLQGKISGGRYDKMRDTPEYPAIVNGRFRPSRHHQCIHGASKNLHHEGSRWAYQGTKFLTRG